jgi:hypothetical protein
MRSSLPLVLVVALAAAGCGGGTLNGAPSTSTTVARQPTTSTSPPTTPATTSRTTPARGTTAPTTTTAPRTTPAPHTTPVPNAAFLAQANGVCSREARTLGAKLKQNPQIMRSRDVRAVAALLLPIEQARLTALRALPAPASIRAGYAQFTGALQARLALLQRAATAGPGAGVVQRLAQSTEQVAALGAALGLSCSG